MSSGREQAALVSGVILAGGQGRRQGRDKATLTLGGRPLAHWLAAALAPAVADLWLITNTPERHAALGLPMLIDLTPGQGALGGLETALFFSRTPYVLAVAVDTPFMPPALVAALAGLARGLKHPALVCASDRGLQPFPGLYATRLLPRLQEFLATDRRLRVFVEQCRPMVLPPGELSRWDPRGFSFLNLNTPEDLVAAQALLADGSGQDICGSRSPGEKFPAPC